MSSTPGYLALSGIEVANNARTAAYLAAGLGTPQFEIVYSDEICPELTDLAYPLEVCAELADATADQFYSSPLPAWRVPTTGAVPTTPRWFEAGYVGFGGAGGAADGALLPDPGEVDVTVRFSLNILDTTPAVNSTIVIGRVVNPGAANVGWVGPSIIGRTTGTWSIDTARRLPGGAAAAPSTLATVALGTSAPPTNWWVEVVFTSVGWTCTVYGSDPAVAGAPVILTAAYGYDASPTSAWAVATGVLEAVQFSTVTQVGLVTTSSPMFGTTEAVVTELDVIPGVPCTATGSSYPSESAWPGRNQYPARYGTFTNPGADNAPWVDPAQPASYGFLGVILYDLENYDSTETRSLDQAASGRGGILGPQMMAPRHLTAKGWAIAQNCEAMEYGRRWLADALAGELCPGCDALEVDLLPLCSSSDASGVRRLYDAGLEELTFDTSDVNSCCYVTPLAFTLAVADPFIYTLPETVIAGQQLAPLAADDPPIAFESWLFSNPDEICVELADEGLGTDAAIVTLTGGDTGITGGLVYRSQGHYPQASMFPGECVYPADGTPQWDISQCPFVFSITLDPGEVFTVNSSRRIVEWQLADGTLLNGAPKLALAPGQTIQWLDTCDGEDAEVCVRATANCTCDTTAAVVVATQHSER